MYESPRITEVGSLPDLTLASGHGLKVDGLFDWGNTPYPDDPPVGS